MHNTRSRALCTKTPLSRGVTGKTFTDTEKNKNNKTEKSTHFLTGITIRQPSNEKWEVIAVLAITPHYGLSLPLMSILVVGSYCCFSYYSSLCLDTYCCRSFFSV